MVWAAMYPKTGEVVDSRVDWMAIILVSTLRTMAYWACTKGLYSPMAPTRPLKTEPYWIPLHSGASTHSEARRTRCQSHCPMTSATRGTD